MRCYFHLSDGQTTILDERGVDVADLSRLRSEAVQAIFELAQEDELHEPLADWRMEVADEAGQVLLMITFSDVLAKAERDL